MALERAPIAVALDAPDLQVLGRWAQAVAPAVSTLKLGLEVYCRDGAGAVLAAREAAAASGASDTAIFLDLKLHDIPATVAGAAGAVAHLCPAILTVHAAGGASMISAAVRALPDTRIAAITVLTSLDDAALLGIGMRGPALDAAVRLARLATAAGARAVVCSPQEIEAIRSAVEDDIWIITPGVRPSGSSPDDQKRVSTPEQAIADGADLLVIGRPITGSPDCAAAAIDIARSVERAVAARGRNARQVKG